MQRNTGYFPTESLEPSGNRLFSRSALNEGDLFRGSIGIGRDAASGLGSVIVRFIDVPLRRTAVRLSLVLCMQAEEQHDAAVGCKAIPGLRQEGRQHDGKAAEGRG